MAGKTTRNLRQTIAYLRVSTLDQDLEKNKADILHFANQHDLGRVQFVEEVASGRTPWHTRRIAQVLDKLQTGDALIVAELSRLGRSMLECMEILWPWQPAKASVFMR
jgi:DNA invertase Pin-like site-specific DNA recombinase